MQEKQQQQSDISQRFVAHRGYAARYAENTLPAIEAALQVGATYVEIDIQLSRDGEAVLFHDRNMMRLCRQPGAVHDYTLSELQAFQVWGQHGDTMRAETGLAHIKQLVDIIKQYPAVTFFIELKRISLEHHGDKLVVDTVLAQLREVQSQVVIISYSLDALAYLRSLSPLPIGVVVDNWHEHNDPAVVALQAEYFFCDINTLPKTGQLSFPSVRIVVFECIDPHRARHVLQQGVDLVETFAIGDMIKAAQTIYE